MFKRLLYLLLVFSLLLSACSPSAARVQKSSPAVSPAALGSEPSPPGESTGPSVNPTGPTPTPLAVRPDDALALDDFSPTETFTVQFTQSMDPASAQPALLVYPLTTGEQIWDNGYTRLSFTPHGGFIAGRDYRIFLNQSLRSEFGATFSAPPEWHLQVRSAPLLEIFERDPDSPLRRPAFHFEFDRPMDFTSVRKGVSISPDVDFDLTGGPTAYTLSLRETLTPGERYLLTIGGQVQDPEGARLGEDYRRTIDSPTVLRRVIETGHLPEEQLVNLQFNDAIDPGSLSASVQLKPPLSGSWQWETDKQASFVTTEAIPYSTAFEVTFTRDLQTTGGETVPAPDPINLQTPPPLDQVIPAEGEMVSPDTDIRAVFTVPPDHASVEAAFSLTPDVPGQVSWIENTFIYRPDTLLESDTTYTAAFRATAKAEDGQPLFIQPYHWTFTTWNDPYYITQKRGVSFGEYGPNAQVLDTDGRRTLQFSIWDKSIREVQFSLYRMDLEQFFDRYTSGFRGVAGRQHLPISLDGMDLFREWPEDVTGSSLSQGGMLVYETNLQGDIPAGFYLLNVQVPGEDYALYGPDQLLLVLTANTLVVKQAGDQIFTWVSDINGGSLPGAAVEIYARDGVLLAAGETDQNGTFATTIDRNPQPLIVAAREGDDVTVSGLSNEWNSDQGWGFWWQPIESPPDFTAFTYTDRPIYKPGQTVFFKTILRMDDDADYSVPPAGTALIVRVRDARDNVVKTFDLQTNELGSANDAFLLAEGAMLGEYHLEVEYGGQTQRQVFKVQDYRKPDYRVSISADREQYLAGDDLRAEIEASYFFGQPVAGAQVTVQRFQLNPQFYGWWGESPPAPTYDWVLASDPISGSLDESGHFTTVLPADPGAYFWDQTISSNSVRRQTYGLEVTVSDGSRQSVSSFLVYSVYNTAIIPSLDLDGYLFAPGQSISVRGELLDLDGQPAAGHPVRLELLRYNRDSYQYDRQAQVFEISSGPDGRLEQRVELENSGSYMARLTGVDEGGRTFTAHAWFYVYRPGDSWAESFSRDIQIRPDRDSYAPGDTAQLTIETPFDGPALLTIERGSTRRSLPVQLTAPLTQVDLPILAADVPNIFVAVSTWQPGPDEFPEWRETNLTDSELHHAAVELKVPPEDVALQVSISADRESYAPRDQAAFTVEVRDAAGNPVSAEVSLALVDESIFSLSDELSGSIFDGFYKPRLHQVRTFNSMALQRYLFVYGRGGGGDQLSVTNPRSDFPDTAAWFPALKTDQDGRVQVTVDLPDSLTSWRLTARAHTNTTQVGEATYNFSTQQPVVIRPALPRILTVGDSLDISAVIHNYSPESLELAVLMQAEATEPGSGQVALQLGEAFSPTIRLEPGDVRVVGFPAEATAAGELAVTVWAVDPTNPDQPLDAVRLPLSIQPLAVPEVNVQSGRFSGEVQTAIILPEEALPDSVFRLQLTRSAAGSLLTGLEYLTGFPYGCVEQTMSRALPNAVVGRAFNQLGVGNPTLLADLPPKINAGLQRLYGYQHNDGGWGWWYDDATHDYQTAWVVFGLTVTAQAGFEVEPAVIERGANWLQENLAAMDPRTRAYALYSLAVAGYGDLDGARAMLPVAGQLDAFSQAALALAFHSLEAADEANQMLDLLAESAVRRDETVYWPVPNEDGHYYQKTMASTLRSTAMALDAFVKIRPGHPFESGIVRFLMDARTPDGWGSTNETAYAILALTDHLLSSTASEGSGYQITLNGNRLADGVLGTGEPLVDLEIPAAGLPSGANPLIITQSGSGELYYTLSSRIYFAKEQIEPAGVIQITRRYLDLEKKPVEAFLPGMLVQVEITMDLPEDGYFLIVEDRLPGGLEALNESLNTTTHVAPSNEYEDVEVFMWEEYGYNNKEVFGDRVSFFLTERPAGRYSLTYMARVTQGGDFLALPAEVAAMYDPAFWGRSASERITIAR